MRRLAIYSGMTDEEAKIMIPETADELQAKMDVELINNGEDASDIEA